MPTFKAREGWGGGSHLLVAPNLRCRCSDLLLCLTNARRASSARNLLALPPILSSSSRMRPPEFINLCLQEGALSSLLPKQPRAQLLGHRLLPWGSLCTSHRPYLSSPQPWPLRSAAMSCTLSRCSLGADLYMSSSNFISWLSLGLPGGGTGGRLGE